MSAYNRNFNVELNLLIGKKVIVSCLEQKTYSGILKGITENLSLVLTNAVSGTESFHKIVLAGRFVNSITLKEIPFDFEGLAKELTNKFKQGNVRVNNDTGVIIVLDRFIINAEGVDGEGPVSDRIRAIWNEYKTNKD